MSIVIFGDNFSFPEGNAATNRIYTYAKGFINNNIQTYVICNRNDYIDDLNGTMDGIHYFNPINQTKRNDHFLVRNWYKVKKYHNTLKLVKTINKQEPVIGIITDTHDFVSHVFSYYLAKRIGTKLIVEKSEHPLRLYQQNTLKKLQGLVKLRIESILCDGLLCISRFLVDYYKEYGLPDRKLVLIPSTVEPERFLQPVEKPLQYSYIGYFGGLTFSRDNVDILIKAYATFYDRHPGINLVVGGFCSDDERKQIENLIIELKLAPRAVLLKYLPRSEVVRYIVHSDILVMVRAKDLETSASFPSKLAEYLVTSKPIVTVDVGEVSDFLTDGVNAFVVEPGNIEKLAEKLEYVIDNYDLALDVASQGTKLTTTIFNYNFQSKRIIEYILSLNT
ncbi:MAG: glycosyltransferase [Bacteroidales bacterium]|nr:glycosyltransferase [Bacteroidales bacterium]